MLSDSIIFYLSRIVNSELTHMKGSVGSLDHITAFGSSLFDIWSVNR